MQKKIKDCSAYEITTNLWLNDNPKINNLGVMFSQIMRNLQEENEAKGGSGFDLNDLETCWQILKPHLKQEILEQEINITKQPVC